MGDLKSVLEPFIEATIKYFIFQWQGKGDIFHEN